MLERMMNDDRYVMLSVGVDILRDVERELLPELRAEGLTAEVAVVGGTTPMEQIPTYIDLVKNTAPLALLVAQAIIAWRRKRREHEQAQQVKEPHKVTSTLVIVRRGKRLNVDDATDAEIIVFLTEQRDA